MPERTIVTIDADHLARTEFTPDDFDFLLEMEPEVVHFEVIEG